MTDKTCKTCRHYAKQSNPQDILADSGVCLEGPPTPVLVPQQNGLALTGMHPPVASVTPACSRHSEPVVKLLA